MRYLVRIYSWHNKIGRLLINSHYLFIRRACLNKLDMLHNLLSTRWLCIIFFSEIFLTFFNSHIWLLKVSDWVTLTEHWHCNDSMHWKFKFLHSIELRIVSQFRTIVVWLSIIVNIFHYRMSQFITAIITSFTRSCEETLFLENLIRNKYGIFTLSLKITCCWDKLFFSQGFSNWLMDINWLINNIISLAK